MLHNTWQICKKCVAQTKQKPLCRAKLLEINFPFAFTQHVTGTEQDDTGATCSMKSELHFRFNFCTGNVLVLTISLAHADL